MSSEQFSSFQIGKMLNVSRQAVNQWIDKGYISSYRTPGGHRRVRQVDLIGFLKDRNIPIPESLLKSMAMEANEIQPRIMVVDNDEDFLVLMQQAILEQLPRAQVTLFSNPFDALISTGTNVPDLLIFDLKMPSLDAMELFRHLRTNQRTRALSIFVVSDHDPMEWRQALKELGIDQVYVKSVSAGEIACQISDMVRAGLASTLS